MTQERSWLLRAGTPDSAPGRLTLFRLDHPTETLDAYVALLSAEERQRAARLRFEVDRRRYIAARARLRLLLAAELRVAPQDLHFTYGVHGKPRLGGALAQMGVHFNLSHSDDLALVGVIRGVELGVDLEATRPLAAPERLAQRHFSRQEYAAYLAAPLPQRSAAFFSSWTRKEALLKARGHGLANAATAPLQDDWSSSNFDAAPGFAAAVAVHCRNCDLKAEAPASSRDRLGPDSA